MSDAPTLIGQRLPLINARKTATGSAQYADDFQLPNMLCGKILRSPHAHARIKKINTARAEKLPGVVAVLTGKECTLKFGVLPISQDETALAVDKANYIGMGVAAVAAESAEIAEQALQLIGVEYEILPAFVEMEDSLKNTPHKIHPETKHASNLHKEVVQHFGNMEQALANAAVVREAHFNFAGITHAFSEPHCVIAHFDEDGRLTVISATQVPHYLHLALSKVLQLDLHRVRVIKPMVGGGFGGKSDPFPHEMVAALLSKKTRRPVKIRFDREEVFLNNHGRHPTKTFLRLSANAQGKLTGLEVDALIDGGAWGSFGIGTSDYNGVLANGPYALENFKYRGRRVYSNKPPSGALRGHGAVNTRYAVETLIDEIAENLKIDPLEFRLQNVLPPNSTTINGYRITSNGIADCLRLARDASDWKNKRGKLPYGEGIGVACGFFISGSALPIHREKFPMSTVHLKIDMDGGVTLYTGASDIGQGSDTMAAQCVAESLKVPLDWVHVKAVDTDLSPVDLGSYSSRVTFMNGNAAIQAAGKIRTQLLFAAARMTGRPVEEMELGTLCVRSKKDPAVVVPWLEVVREAMHNHGALLSSGCYQEAPKMGGDFKGSGAGLSPAYSLQAFVSQVKVDHETGQVRVKKVWAAHDCGRVLNRLAVEGQIEGSIHMGLGQLLGEEIRYDQGRFQNATFLDYKMLTPLETPEIEVILVESHDPEGPFGAKEAGEGPLLPIQASVANAVYDAVGIRVRELPMLPPRVLKLIEDENRKEGK